jgi:hypothetical protein
VKGLDDMEKVTLRDYAIMIEKTVQEAKNYAEKINALEIGYDNIYVRLDKIQTHVEKEIIDCLKNVNSVCIE